MEQEIREEQLLQETLLPATETDSGCEPEEKPRKKPRKKPQKKNGAPVLFLRPVVKKCMIKGCRNTDSVAVSRNPEFGNTVILCKECARALSDRQGGKI